MNNLLALIKVDLKETLDTRKFKENKAKSTSFLTFVVLFLILGIFLSVVYNLMFTSLFHMAGESLVYSTILMAGLTSLLTFSTSVFKVKSIFIGKDYEMLSAMPISKNAIIASKIINLYLLELLYSAIIMIPNMIINIIFSQNLIYLPTGLLLTILIPAVPMVIACLFSLFITLVADRFKFGNVINVILYLILFAAIFGFSFMMNMNTGSADETIDASNYMAMANIMAWLNPTLHFVKFAVIDNYAFILLFIGINLLLSIGVVFFISLFFDKVHELINSFKSNVVYVRKKLDIKGQFKTLFFNESKRFFTSKYYFINSISSGIVAILMGGMMGYMFGPNSFIGIPSEDIAFFGEYAYVGALIIVFGIGIATPASVSISIEGNNFWLIKSSPIDIKKWIKAKILLSTLVLGVCAIVASILMVALMNGTVYSYIMMILITVGFVLLSSITGLKINLGHPKLNWKNEQEVVKNSAGVVLSMFADWGITLVLAAILVGLSFVNIYLAGISTLAFELILSLILYLTLMNNCERKINLLEQ